MPYTINKTNGTLLATISDGTVDNTSDLTLVGKNYAGYGEILNENFVKLIENFANSTAPTKPIAGQLWWDVTNSTIKVYVSGAVGFKSLGKITNASSAPSNNVTGDLWWDSANSQLKVYDGSGFVTVGPATPSSFGSTGAQPELIVDSAAGNHYVVSLYAFSTRVAIISKDAEFTPATPIAGFTTIRPGINLAASGVVPGIQLTGTASNADLLDSLNSTDFMRATANTSTTGTMAVSNDSGMTVGADADFRVSVSGANVTIQNQTVNGNLHIRVAGNVSPAISVNGVTGLATVLAEPTTSLGIATKSYVDNLSTTGSALNRAGSNTITGVIVPDTNGTINFGSTTRRFDTIFANTFNGTSTQALYADVAERFEADQPYPAGTVVALGGVAEITAEVEELSDDVFGVISTRAAHLMNAGAGTDETHPPVALTGRVPVRVVGKVKKGDRLVSAGSGLARAAKKDEITAFNVIGRSLESKTTDGEGTVVAVVTLNS